MKGLHLVIVCGLLFAILLCGGACYQIGTQFDKTITVERTFQNIAQDGDTYMVADDRGNSYRVSDCVWWWNWRSTDLWNSLKPGKTYRITAYGWRVGFVSWYPNIVRAEPASVRE